MNRRTLRQCALWLLPILALRAFVPVGFMVSMDARGLQLAFCPTQAPALAAAFAIESASIALHDVDQQHHHPSATADKGSPSAVFDAPCPYALGAIAVVADAPRLAADLAYPLDEFIPFRERLVPSSGPVRAATIRGPPLLS